MRNSNYNRDGAKAVIECILARLAVGQASTPELVVVTGRSEARGRDYIKHMAAIGQVLCVSPQRTLFKGSTPAVWALNPDYVVPPIETTPFVSPPDWITVDDFPRRVVVRQQWAPNHARGPMECLLFGVPIAMQMAAP